MSGLVVDPRRPHASEKSERDSEGRVVNIIRPTSASVIVLEEFKPRFDATFAPLLRGVIRNRMRRFVLEPMRQAAEQERPRRKARWRRAEVHPERPRVRRR